VLLLIAAPLTRFFLALSPPLAGTGEAWSAEYLAETIKFDHGYTSQSAPIHFLLEVLCEMDGVEQRRFLRFVTGSPRLPPGGLAALQPSLTVVRKHSHTHSQSITGEGTTPPLGSLGLGGASGGSAGSMPGGGKHPADGDLPSGAWQGRLPLFCQQATANVHTVLRRHPLQKQSPR
jgi:E3 ubiquitin-protein ligase TRIP12